MIIRSFLCWLKHGSHGWGRFRLSFIRSASGKTVFIKTCMWCETDKAVGDGRKNFGMVGK